MDIARDIYTDNFYIVNSGLPCIEVTAVVWLFANATRNVDPHLGTQAPWS